MAPPDGPVTSPPPTTYRGAVATILETANELKHPEDPKWNLQLGEGTYVLRDILELGLIPFTTNDPWEPNPNHLDARPKPPRVGSKLTLATLALPVDAPYHRSPLLDTSRTLNGVENSGPVPQNGNEAKLKGFAAFKTGNLKGLHFGGGGNDPNTAQGVTKETRDTTKRKKPKSSFTKPGSSFLSRVSPCENLSKRLQERKTDGKVAFVNKERALLFLDFTSHKAEQLIKMLFARSHPLCHDINRVTKTSSHLDVIVGFSTSDITWLEPIQQKYSRINKNGCINATPVASIQWVPGSENLFAAAHYDGSIIIYDKEKADPDGKADKVYDTSLDQTNPPNRNGKRKLWLQTKRSAYSKYEKNPVAYYQVTKRRINGHEFSPDGRFIAVVSEDGSLRVIDLMREQLIDVYTSYYGGLTCVAWSPDGKYIATGGQDDLLSIWSFEERELVARCSGHRSWVTGIAFDPWRCDDRSYRFASVGEDRRLLIWDLSVGLLHNPRAASIRPSVSSVALVQGDDGAPASPMAVNTGFPNEDDQRNSSESQGIFHDPEPRGNVSTLPPVMAKQIDNDFHTLSYVGFEPDCLITACSAGHIMTWDRPEVLDHEDLNVDAHGSGNNPGHGHRVHEESFSNPFPS